MVSIKTYLCNYLIKSAQYNQFMFVFQFLSLIAPIIASFGLARVQVLMRGEMQCLMATITSLEQTMPLFRSQLCQKEKKAKTSTHPSKVRGLVWEIDDV